jgi:hypothetical protein
MWARSKTSRPFAREARRVGRGYWIQTPAHEFPIEPHYWAPFVHWFPKRIQRRLLRNFTLWGLMGRPSDRLVEMALAEVRLMRRREVEQLFPDGEIWIERLLGLAKSYTAFARPRVAQKQSRSVPISRAEPLSLPLTPAN